nr:hypothetical protein [Didymella theifolia botybirnavirus 1]
MQTTDINKYNTTMAYNMDNTKTQQLTASGKHRREPVRLATLEQKERWQAASKRSKKTRESFFNGFCWLAIIKRADRQLATSLIGRWPTAERLRIVMAQESIRFADGGFSAILVSTDTVGGSTCFHIVPGSIPAKAVLDSIHDSALIGGEVAPALDWAILTAAVLLLAASFSRYVRICGGQSLNMPAHRRLPTLGPKGFKAKQMPTKTERAGARAAGVYGDDSARTSIVEEVVEKRGLWESIVTWTPDEQLANAQAYGRVLVQPTVHGMLSLTSTISKALGTINFKDTLSVLAPSTRIQRIAICWGYNLERLPPTRVGTAYSDEYGVALWGTRPNYSDKARPYKPPVKTIQTGVGYYTPRVMANEIVAGSVDNADKLVEARDMTNYFDKMKKIPAIFTKAGDVKSQYGDNHVGMLVQWWLMLAAVTQAKEQGAACTTQLYQEALDDYTLDVTPKADSRETTEWHINARLAEVWSQAEKIKPFNMVLPSDSATHVDVVHLMFLSGMLVKNDKFVYKGRNLGILPTYYLYQTDVKDYLRIPLCNSLETINLKEQLANTFVVTPGGLEATIVDYVRRMGLQDQMTTAQMIGASIMAVASNDGEGHSTNVVPMPNHVQEYDLWISRRALGVQPSWSLVQGENFTFLSALLQTQGDVLMDTVATKLMEHVSSKDLALTTNAGIEEAHAFMSETISRGQSQLISAWATYTFGYKSVELQQALNLDASHLVGLIRDTLATGVLRPASLLIANTTIAQGPISMVWDETTRNREAAKIYATNPVSKMLTYIYSNEPQIFKTHGPLLANFAMKVSRRRDQRQEEHSVGLRRISTIVGKPKILYMGTVVKTETMATRLAHAGTGPQLAAHYEPFFDADSTLQDITSDIPLFKGPTHRPADAGPTHMHANDFTNTNQMPKAKDVRSRRNSIAALGKGIVATAGKIIEWAGKQPTGDKTVPEASIFEYENIHAGEAPFVLAQYVNDQQNAHENGLINTIEAMDIELKERAQGASGTVSEPEENKGSEIIVSNPVNITRLVNKQYNKADSAEEDFHLPEEMGVGLLEHIEVVKTKGDGRCGARAIHTQLMAAGKQVTLAEVMKVEAEIYGLKTKRAENTIWATDETLFLIAQSFGCNLLIFCEAEDGNPRIETIRDLMGKSVDPYLHILSQPTHWTAMKLPFEIDTNNVDTLNESIQTYLLNRPVRSEGGPEGEKGADRPEGSTPVGFARTLRARKPYYQQATHYRKPGPSHRKLNDRIPVEVAPEPQNVPVNEVEIENVQKSGLTETWESYLQTQVLKRGGFTRYELEETLHRMDDLPVSPKTLEMQDTGPLNHTGVLQLLDQGNDQAWKDREFRSFESKYGMPGEWYGPFENAFSGYWGFKTLLGHLGAQANLVRTTYSYTVLKLKEVITWRNQSALYSTFIPTFMELDGRIYYLHLGTKSTYRGPVSHGAIIPYLNDIRATYLDHSYMVQANSSDRMGWGELVENKLAEMGVRTTSQSTGCTRPEMEMLFPKGRGQEDSAADILHTNIEKLAGAMLLAGYRREAKWVIYQAATWVRDELGFFPEDPNWFGERALALLANAKGIKLWVISTDQTSISESVCNETLGTIPVCLYLEPDTQTLTPCSIRGNALKLGNVNEFMAHCKALRDHHGKIPEPPLETPVIPSLKTSTKLSVGTVVAITLLGVAAAGLLVVTGVTLYKRKARAARVGTFVNEAIRREATAPDREVEQPLLAPEPKSIWDDNWSMSSVHSDAAVPVDERASVHSCKTIPLGGDPLMSAANTATTGGRVQEGIKKILDKSY